MPSPAFRRRAPLGLLFAALLQLLGGAGFTATHVEVRSGAPTAVFAAGSHDEGAPTAPHDAQHCAVCHALGASALPSAGPASAAPSAARHRAPRADPAPPRAPRLAHAPARAPPRAA
jgi:mono/diheme cytochrome c family protein